MLIASDIRLHRESLAQCLATFRGVIVVAQASSADEALQLTGTIRPEVILLDIGTERSLDLAAALNRQSPDTSIIAIGVHDDEHEVVACAEAGVAGCFPSNGSISELKSTIIGCRCREVGCSPKAANALFRRVASLARQVRAQAETSALTHREAQIVSLIEKGLSNKEIAQQLNIEVATVKNHVHHILEKLQVTSRYHAARRLRATGGRRRIPSPDESPLNPN